MGPVTGVTLPSTELCLNRQPSCKGPGDQGNRSISIAMLYGLLGLYKVM